VSAVLPWHDAAWRSLAARRAAGRLPAALLLAGTQGTGKRRFAELLVRALHCAAPDGPCGACQSCALFAAGTHPDHQVLERAVDEETGKSRKDISIEQVRSLIGDLQLASQRGGWKSALIVPADALNASSANALLKTLEEPPARTLLVLVSSRPDRLLPTIRSRCQRVALRVPDRAVARAWLESEEPRSDWDLWLGIANGAPLGARELAGSAFGQQRTAWAKALLALPQGRGDPVRLADEWVKADPRAALRWWATLVADMIGLVQAGVPPARNPDLEGVLRELGARVDLGAMHRFLGALQRASGTLETTVSPALVLESLLIAWAAGLTPDSMRPILADERH
jgi:DNA polymerase-3 subunit delta'